MKKYVSAALVAAMIASMGVSAMADVSFGSGASSDVAWPTDFGFGDKLTVISSNDTVTEYGENQKISLKPGDTIYMPLTHTAMVEEEAPETETPETETPEVETPETPETDNENSTPETDEEIGTEEENNGSTEETPDEEIENEEESTPVVAAAVEATVPYSGKVDKDWKIRFSAGKYVNNASFYTATANDTNLVNGALYIKVDMDSFLDSVDKESIAYNVYISESGTRNKSGKGIVKADFANTDAGKVSFDSINFVGEPSIWEAETERSGDATFEFNGDAFFDVTMFDGEKVLLGLSRDYIREIGIANENAELNFFNFQGSHDEFIRKGTLSIYGDEDSYVYELIDGKLYDVDFDYNEDEETIEIVTNELGHYVVSDMELEAKDFKPSKPSKPSTDNSTDKNNPSTGASDFVGAAAALAVASVTAAGALALKGKK